MIAIERQQRAEPYSDGSKAMDPPLRTFTANVKDIVRRVQRLLDPLHAAPKTKPAGHAPIAD
jgi:hypothetical protein